jgi:hypothetical protein
MILFTTPGTIPTALSLVCNIFDFQGCGININLLSMRKIKKFMPSIQTKIGLLTQKVKEMVLDYKNDSQDKF